MVFEVKCVSIDKNRGKMTSCKKTYNFTSPTDHYRINTGNGFTTRVLGAGWNRMRLVDAFVDKK